MDRRGPATLEGGADGHLGSVGTRSALADAHSIYRTGGLTSDLHLFTVDVFGRDRKDTTGHGRRRGGSAHAVRVLLVHDAEVTFAAESGDVVDSEEGGANSAHQSNGGEDDGDNVSMSDDGNTVAIGYVVDDVGNNESLGRVRIFDWK